MSGGQRIDKWLWHARFARTRTAAQSLARSGKVRLNRDKTDSPSRIVKIGDVLTIVHGQMVRVVRIAAIAEKRGSATIAQGLYEEVEPPIRIAAPKPAPGAGPRPNKRDRRILQELKRGGAAG